MSKHLVEYRLAYDHVVQVAVEANSAEEAEAEAGRRFDAGTIWDDTPDCQLVYDDYEEQNDNVLEFRCLDENFTGDPDASAGDTRARELAVKVARGLVEAYDRGFENGGEIDWEDVDAVHVAALEVLRLMGIPHTDPTQADEAGEEVS